MPMSRQICEDTGAHAISSRKPKRLSKGKGKVTVKPITCKALILVVNNMCHWLDNFLCFEISVIQVKPFGCSVSCSMEDFGSIFDAPFPTSTPIKRPRLKDRADEINNTSLSTLRESTTCDST